MLLFIYNEYNINKIVSLSFFAIILISAIFVVGKYNNSSAQEPVNNCYGATINISSEAGQTTTLLRGLVNVNVTVPTGTPQISSILIGKQDANGGNKKVLGRARYSNNQVWTMPWLTSLLNMSTMDRYQNYLYAEVSYSGTTTSTKCLVTSTSQYNIEYQTQSNLIVIASPREWSGLTNSTQLFSLSLSTSPINTTVNFDPLQYAIINWKNNGNIGSLVPNTTTFSNKESSSFISGHTAGTTKISAMASYGGAEVVVEIPITVSLPAPVTTVSENPTTTNSTETNTNQTTNTSTTADNSNQQSTTSDTPTSSQDTATTTNNQITSSKIQIDEATTSCIKTLIGVERFEAINSGASKPKAEELSKTSACFASTKYILPIKFAPIDPVKISEVAIASKATVDTIKNTPVSNDSEVKKLIFSGKAEPNSFVLVYIFSDPIIVTVTTDSSGNWEYTLEDPMQPGKHEVYAIINKGDGSFERTNPMEFFITTAQASEVNPDGLNLELSDIPRTSSSLTPNFIFYIAGSIVVVLIALTIFFLTLKSHNFHRLALINRKHEIRLDAKSYNYPKTNESEPIANQTATSLEPLNDAKIVSESDQFKKTTVNPSEPTQVAVTSDDSTDTMQPNHQNDDSWHEQAQPTVENDISENTNDDNYESQ